MRTKNTEENLLIVEEIKSFIAPLSSEEFALLERDIIANGCRDPLTAWKRGSDLVLIDGHHRYKICKKHDIGFEIDIKRFDSREQVQIWMLNNQMGRRNLTSDQLSYYRGKKYLLLKKDHGGYDFVANKGSKGAPTSRLLSSEFKVAESTIKRDAKFAEGLELIGQSNPLLKASILVGDTNLKKGDIQFLSEIDQRKKATFKVKNEADLFNKIAQFRKENLDIIEQKLDEIEQEKYAAAKAELVSRDTMFLDKDERLQRLKGRIISAINDAIKNKNVKAISALKELMDSLYQELAND